MTTPEKALNRWDLLRDLSVKAFYDTVTVKSNDPAAALLRVRPL
jgi:hypothetical protein